jgi:uncharacterized SAM-binding protein YcdF (DUF218 family)
LTEAEAFSARLIELGVPSGQIVREMQSQTTRGNAEHVASIVREKGLRRLGVVTCDWHMRRALVAFARHSLSVEAVPAFTADSGIRRAAARFALERARALGDAVAVKLQSLVAPPRGWRR